ncbi:MAG: glycoside hydrolase family 3 domain protein [Rariglobus sp.]|jgi:beta-glucosidase|nr:glycoside hydrolase family 3 domain protein [Rariglobus sp.]
MTALQRPWLNKQLPLEERVETLLSAMTLEEKIGQMWQVHDPKDQHDQNVREGRIGSFLNVPRDQLARLQRIAVEESRLGVPIVAGRDVIHGYRTLFPIPLGQAASFNPETVRLGAKIAAREASAAGIHWTFAPMVDISRDPRWGRIAESLGEDPVLASRLGVAMVEGFQGDDPAAPDSIAACVKHYVGYGAAEGGRDYNTALIPESELRNVYLPPFRACAEAGALSFMSAFNDLNGVPTSGNPHTIRNILKTEWNYPGMVVSDWCSITEMINHGYACDEAEAAQRSIAAGVDLEMVSESYRNHAAGLLRAGKLRQEWIDDAARRVLRMKFVLGLFDNPYPAPATPEIFLCEPHLQAARRAATESCVLLKNNGALPLSPSGLKRVAIIGPLANAGADQVGCWAMDARGEDSQTPLAALRQSLPSTVVLDYSPGVPSSRSVDTTGFAEAIAQARAADVVLLFLGEEALLSGEAHSRAFLTLPGSQQQLLEAIAATGKTVVLVIMAGRPLVLTPVLPHASAVLYAWHPGTMGGPALADLLLGKESPSGKLPVSFPVMEGQIPAYYNKRNTGRPPSDESRGLPQGTPLDPVGFSANYIDGDHLPLFPFGFGLSYTRFEYQNLTLKSSDVRAGGVIEASIELRNAGSMPATETVQLYVRDLFASLTRPVRELKDFQRVTLAPGETRVVAFKLPAEQLAFYDNEAKRHLEAGDFKLWIGGDSRCTNEAAFRLLA